jgi:UDP-GlcNAc:undecaprenyl-phosphate GlcNAc-1-phosphate transferase
MLVMHAMGCSTIAKRWGRTLKLLIQLAVAAFVVIAFDMRALTALDKLGAGRWPSVIVTVLWIVAITNAFNFLDNMDGLSAGVAACARRRSSSPRS